jgi:hypothetical protein
MFVPSWRSAVALASGALALSASLLAFKPIAAAAAENEIEIREWNVPYEGRPRDPFAAGLDEVWFVGQMPHHSLRKKTCSRHATACGYSRQAVPAVERRAAASGTSRLRRSQY